MVSTVAIVGRPNVGKSTLFNRLVGGRPALVADEAGMTRDRHYATTSFENQPFLFIDTGGFDPDAEVGSLDAAITAQADLAIAEADTVIVVFDAKDGVTVVDRDLVDRLRRRAAAQAVMFVVNKVDGAKQKLLAHEFSQLGIDPIFPVSAEHGLGLEDLLDALLKEAASAETSASEVDTEDQSSAHARIALVGRPNAGKSSLLNRLVGQERAIVSDLPGTTRDIVDVTVETPRGTFVVVDTAGIRRKRRRGSRSEQIACLRALRAVMRADVACLLIDASVGVTIQDIEIANEVIEAGCGLLFVYAKADLLQDDRASRKALTTAAREQLAFANYAPLLFLSAAENTGVKRLFPEASKIFRNRDVRISTSELNQFLADTLAAHAPPSYRGRPLRFNYVTQPGVRPPRFVFQVNHPQGVPASYRRYLSSSLRRRFGFAGTPIRILLRAKKRRD